MRKAIVIGLASALLAAPAGAEAAVTLDPGTKLTVRCNEQMPFRGLPFTRTDTGDALIRRDNALPRTVPRSIRVYELWRPRTNPSPDPAVLEAGVRVRRLGNRAFRLRVYQGVEQATQWRGC